MKVLTPEGLKSRVTFYFGCERNLSERPSQRQYDNTDLGVAFRLFCGEHGLENNAATRASIMCEVIDDMSKLMPEPI